MNFARSFFRHLKIGSLSSKILDLSPFQLSIVVFFLLVIVVSGLSLGTPLGSSQDEPAHTIAAVADVRGQFIKPSLEVDGGTMGIYQVKVPDIYTRNFVTFLNITGCYAPYSPANAACFDKATMSTKIVDTWTYTGGYPPLYYLLVGWPSLLNQSLVSFYLMRICSAILCSAVVTCAFYCLRKWSTRPLASLMFLFAVTPTAIYTFSAVQPSGLEISSAFLMWVGGSILVFEDFESFPRGLLIMTAIGTSLLTLSRPISIVFTAFIALVLFLFADPRVRRSLYRDRYFRKTLALPTAAILFTVFWLIKADPLLGQWKGSSIWVYPPTDLFDIFSQIFGNSVSYVYEWIATLANGPAFGAAPMLTVGAYFLVLSFVIFLSASERAQKRQLWASASVLVASILFPPVLIVLSTLVSGGLGVLWHGRYSMPLGLGIPVFLFLSIRKVPTNSRRVINGAIWLCFVGQVMAYYTLIRDVTEGINGPWNLATHWVGQWTPPIPAFAIFGGGALCLFAYCALMAGMLRRAHRAESDKILVGELYAS